MINNFLLFMVGILEKKFFVLKEKINFIFVYQILFLSMNGMELN